MTNRAHWKKGQSGNPEGRRSEKIITDQLRLVLNEPISKESKIKKIRLLAETLVNEAIDGNVQAIKEIMDRVEGKAPQVHDHDHQHNHSVEPVSETAQWLGQLLRERANGKDKEPLPH